ncbi:hypothetical protein XBJ2_750002 [Xenorhabdus bovienii str. Jollieti]|uniref:Uncharacterized protein n=1 Tax=Xenorhabdus bovienii (strain SS-2004) TaxID=406818 RepID=D3V092_XENBS|nr:hypothetical protein XBJ1_1517 [Xenorhabdus bovienii SS-2004]CDH30352.1 hypothetical protein XBJ2_750002 [Xenorhabdus bovienii str. Jollieti]
MGHDIDRIMEAFKRVSDQGHRSGFAQKTEALTRCSANATKPTDLTLSGPYLP